MTTVNESLESIEADFQRLFDRSPSEPLSDMATPFEKIGDLGFQLEGDFSQPLVRDWAARNADLVWRIAPALLFYHADVVDYLEDPWEEAAQWPISCRMWSNGVFFRELFDGTDALERFYGFSPELDLQGYAMMAFRGRVWARRADVPIPAGTPLHHWWWWLPERPPSGDYGPPDIE